MYSVEFGPSTTPTGRVLIEDTGKDTWAIRSTCADAVCMADIVVDKRNKQMFPMGGVPFDLINDHWVGVTSKDGECKGIKTTSWNIWDFAPQPDGTLTGGGRRPTQTAGASAPERSS